MATRIEERYARSMFYGGLILSLLALLLSALALAQPAEAAVTKTQWVTINYLAPTGGFNKDEPNCGEYGPTGNRAGVNWYGKDFAEEHRLYLTGVKYLSVCTATLKVVR